MLVIRAKKEQTGNVVELEFDLTPPRSQSRSRVEIAYGYDYSSCVGLTVRDRDTVHPPICRAETLYIEREELLKLLDFLEEEE